MLVDICFHLVECTCGPIQPTLLEALAVWALIFVSKALIYLCFFKTAHRRDSAFFFCEIEVLGNRLQVRIVQSRHYCGELGHCSDCVINMRTTSNISIHHFSKKGTVTKTRFKFMFICSSCSFISTILFEDFMNNIVRKGRKCCCWPRKRSSRHGISWMSLEHPINTVLTRDYDMRSTLFNINTINIYCCTKIGKGWTMFIIQL